MSEDNRTPKPPYFKHVKFGLYALILLIIVGWIYMLQLKMDTQSATNNTKTLAESGANSTYCDIYKQDDFCKKVKEIAENPTTDVAANTPAKDGKDGTPGQNGAPGRGIQTFDSSSGSLVVKYTDNTIQNLGRIVGKDGKDGANGAPGKTGATGTAGTPGRGILAADLKDGSLIVSYTDGSFQNVGNIVGPKGDTGAAGKDGTNGTNGTDGKDGAPGKDAIYPTSVDSDLAGNVVISYSDGTTAQAGRIILPTVEIFTCENDTLTFKLTNDTVKTVRVDCSPDIANPPAAPQNNPAPTLLP